MVRPRATDMDKMLQSIFDGLHLLGCLSSYGHDVTHCCISVSEYLIYELSLFSASSEEIGERFMLIGKGTA